MYLLDGNATKMQRKNFKKNKSSSPNLSHKLGQRDGLVALEQSIIWIEHNIIKADDHMSALEEGQGDLAERLEELYKDVSEFPFMINALVWEAFLVSQEVLHVFSGAHE